MCFLVSTHLGGSCRLLICYVSSCGYLLGADLPLKTWILLYIYAFFEQLWTIFLGIHATYCISDFRFCLCALLRVFWHTFCNMTAKIWKFTKFHDLESPKCEKFRQIWPHQSMRRKKLSLHMQTWYMKASHRACIKWNVSMRKPYFYKRDYIYIHIYIYIYISLVK